MFIGIGGRRGGSEIVLVKPCDEKKLHIVFTSTLL